MAMKPELKLFALPPSPFSQIVTIALKEKGILYDLVEIDATNKPKELLEANPVHKKVPTIVHNGKSVPESLVILQYLEEAFPSKVHLLPEDAYGKSQMRFWADYSHQFYSKILPNIFAQPDSPMRAAADEVTADALKTLEEGMLSLSADGPFFAGEKFGYVDVVLAPIVVLLAVEEHLCGLSVPSASVLPRFHKWAEAVKAHPSVHETLPSSESGIAIFTGIRKARAAAAAAAAAAANRK